MQQSALRKEAEFDTDIVRRLMARPLRLVAEPVLAPAPTPSAPVVETPVASADISKLKAQVMVMKAVLGAERREADRLRACIARIEDPTPLGPEAQAVRDRWAALVDQLLHAPR